MTGKKKKKKKKKKTLVVVNQRQGTQNKIWAKKKKKGKPREKKSNVSVIFIRLPTTGLQQMKNLSSFEHLLRIMKSVRRYLRLKYSSS